MQDEILLTIDGSTKSTGYAIFKNKQLIDHGVLAVSGGLALDRIPKMVKQIEEVVIKYNPTRIVMEEVLPEDVKHNQKVFKPLMYLQGDVRIMLNKYKKDAELVEASHWRRICNIKTGRGVRRESLKKSDVLFVKTKYNIEVNDDEADAICIGYAKIHEEAFNSNDINDFEFR
jgi:Holliday junction resolvasome RuvABC endonuclease subunit